LPFRADITLSSTSGLSQFDSGGTVYLVQTPTGVLYAVYIDSGADIVYRKSSDNGLTWAMPIVIYAGTAVQLAVWYDRWSNISAGLIHCVYSDSGNDDTFYRTVNTESSDALSTQTTIFLGASTATTGHLSVTRAVGGNVYCKTVIDAGAEGGFYRLPTANVPNGAWDAALTVDETIAANDAMILLPDFDAADNQDILAIFWDTSASEISRKLFDNSGNSWSESSIATSMTKQTSATSFPSFAAAPDITNTRSLLVAWSNVDTLNADLRCWTVDAGAISETSTNVVLNSTDDQGLAAIALDTTTGKWWVFYVGASGGSETFKTSVNIYCKVSSDSGSTWGPETKLTNLPYAIGSIWTTPTFSSAFGPPPVAFHMDTAAVDAVAVNVAIPTMRAQHQMYGG
jgi:hypothetical protein